MFRMDTMSFLCGVIEGFYGRPWTQAQRLELLGWMSDWGMNTYMYGPKDDLKMRAAWREPYTEAELAELASLAAHCHERGIAFIYTIAPGLDVHYSDGQELALLKAKIDQLLDKGVEHFCILFDDIPFEMSPADEVRFGSFAGAQVYVTNELLKHIRRRNEGRFLFCPTDYCARMAKPSVAASAYLKELGEGLDEAIDIFWTGPEIVSATISLESVQELQTVLKRKPLIWDNLHANDYDIRRVYLGPYAGRSFDLKAELSGILTNPNNEFAANFVPLKTLAMYAVDDAYEPRAAYQTALKAWLPRFKAHGEAITLAELELLGDLFYLFFENGERAKGMLTDIKKMLFTPPEAWGDALGRLEETAANLGQLFRKLTELDNRDLLYSLYGYVWEMEHTIRYTARYLAWLKAGKPGGQFGRPDQLANTFRTGLVAELERLLPLDAEGKVAQ